MAALSPAASELTLVSTMLVCREDTAAAPAVFIWVPVPTWALVSLSEITTATAAPTPVSPLAPLRASVDVRCVPTASTVMLPALPPMSAPSLRSAVVSLNIRLSANDAPTPTLSATAPSPAGSALAVLSVVACARTLTAPMPLPRSPPSASVTSPTTSALVTTAARLMATEPATPTLPPPAPEVELAKMLCVRSVRKSSSETSSDVSTMAVPPRACSRESASWAWVSSRTMT